MGPRKRYDEWEDTMAERKSSSRWSHFLMMLPFFLLGIAIPVYFYGFSGDGPPIQRDSGFNPSPEAEPSFRASRRDDGIVGASRNAFDRTVDNYGGRGASPLVIKLGLLGLVFVVGYFLVRIVLHALSGVAGAVGSFLVHKAAGPMFMGFVAVGSTWGIHQTVANEFGLTWAAATISITAAIATLLALAGVRVRG
jgi:hypothetical protein